MAKYKAYPEYKDSGVEWLGEIPIHWEMLRHKYVAFFTKGKNPTNLLEQPLKNTLPYLSMECLRNNTTDKYALISNDVRIALEGQPLIIWDGSNAGEFVKGKSGILSSTMAAATLTYPLHPQYYWYVCISIEPEMRKNAVGMGIPHVNGDELKSISFSIPSFCEQKQIAVFLDHETAKIDKLIEKQQQLIELLKEKRQAVISHAVTKGLNPDVPMKDSGVEWLGEIPQHWGVTRLKYECRNIVDCPHSTPNYTDEGEYPAIRTADILAGYLDLENCRRVTEPVYDERNFRLIPKAGDIIYSREGERFGIGAPIPEGAKVCLAQRVMLFRAKSTPGYLMWALNSSSTYTQAQQDCIGSTSPHVNVDTIKNFILAWPPENEREEISNFIHQTLDSVESLTAHLTEKLTLLQERRTALISAAVTGKIDVRDWVAPDTQDVEEPQEATA
ncbi:TPA: restriction endonuclease subunit S [Klebsiella pneumoniae]|uniref:restriction endonuclease subunit S n=1 Tax=Klebsiella pneumoniae TaxID=573 RepID=UPI0028C6EDA0|nr:restriction endonuclease subunit S [Klebsiella pneumoniae]HDZ1273615.1 restriction endonuclease subunit S [Klebsiella pneumoniae]HDZ1654099.1 restriction endonuclease subunit S [Klebsiella pneumoniae]